MIAAGWQRRSRPGWMRALKLQREQGGLGKLLRFWPASQATVDAAMALPGHCHRKGADLWPKFGRMPCIRLARARYEYRMRKRPAPRDVDRPLETPICPGCAARLRAWAALDILTTGSESF